MSGASSSGSTPDGPAAGSGASPDTIFAVASGFGRSAIAVIRISGPDAGAALERLCGARPKPRRASLRQLRSKGGEPLDQALVLWLPGPSSFTGEDCAELHIHGGTAVRAALIRELAQIPGLRSADPGEFTRRAFLNGRLDLSAVEGLADLIDAETEAQRRQALRQHSGALAEAVSGWRARLIAVAASLEAALDFSDQDDIPEDVSNAAGRELTALAQDVDRELDKAARGERLRDGFVAVIAGPPNAGKSTLLNALAGRDVAIVSPVAGTTRDALEVRCDLAGLPVTFVDTAGLRETRDPLEAEGISRARRRLGEADLVLWLQPADAEIAPPPEDAPLLVLVTKADVSAPSVGALAVSAKTGEGLDALLDAIRQRAEQGLSDGSDALITRERHRRALEEVSSALGRAASVHAMGGGEELVAEDLRLGLRALGRITGQVDVEEVLDQVFAQFCIGK